MIETDLSFALNNRLEQKQEHSEKLVSKNLTSFFDTYIEQSQADRKNQKGTIMILLPDQKKCDIKKLEAYTG
jgi:hypothetical protein